MSSLRPIANLHLCVANVWHPGLVGPLLLLALLANGCSRPAPPAGGSSTADRSPSIDARQTLKDHVADGRRRDTYAAKGTLTLLVVSGNQQHLEQTQIDLQFQKPNRLRLEIASGINALRVVCDGQYLWAAIDDPVTDNLDSQTVQQPAPALLTMNEVYRVIEMVNPSRPNALMNVLLGMPLDLGLSQLGWAVPSDALDRLLEAPWPFTSMPDETLDGRAMTRIRIATEHGDTIFWNDGQTGHLRRIEYPTANLFAHLPEPERPQQVSLVLDVEESEPPRPDDHAFQFAPTEQALLVQHFVLPPTPLAHEQLGQPIPRFDLFNSAHQTESYATWQAKPTVLIWFDRHEASQAVLTAVSELASSNRQPFSEVNLRVVCAESEAELSDEQVDSLLQSWQVSLPWLRDRSAAGRDRFGIDQAPTLVVLDGKGRLEAWEVGASPLLPQWLPPALTRLLTGTSLADEALTQHDTEVVAYQRALQLAAVHAGDLAAPDAGQVAEVREPEKLTRSTAWQCSELESAGNLFVVASPAQPPEILAIDASSRVARISSTGEVLQRTSIGEGAIPITRIAAFVSAEGRSTYVGWTMLGQQVIVMDDQLQPLLRYPVADQTHPGTVDANLLDLDGDGTPELYVAFADPVGLHCVALDGTRLWSNRSVTGIASIAGRPSARPPHLLVTGEAGVIVPMSSSGTTAPPIEVPQRVVHQLTQSGARDVRPAEYLGLSFTLEGRLIAVGLDSQLAERWSYGLPAGVYRTPVQIVRWAPVLDDQVGQWLLAGPDGSVHLVSDDGSFYDYFCVGSDIQGLAGYRRNGEGTIVISTREGVTAHAISAVGR